LPIAADLAADAGGGGLEAAVTGGGGNGEGSTGSIGSGMGGGPGEHRLGLLKKERTSN